MIYTNKKQSWNFGEVSPLLYNRYDLEKYNNGSMILDNFLNTVQGPIIRRGGTRHIYKCSNGTNKPLFIKFFRNKSDKYLIELGNYYARFYKNDQIILLNNQPYQITTPWSQSSLFNQDGSVNLKYIQSLDVLFVVNSNTIPYKFNRYSDTNWTITSLEGWDSSDPNPTNITLWRERLCLSYNNTIKMSQTGAFGNFIKKENTISRISGSFYNKNSNISTSYSNSQGNFIWEWNYKNTHAEISMSWDIENASISVGSSSFQLTAKSGKILSKVTISATGIYDGTTSIFRPPQVSNASGSIYIQLLGSYSYAFVQFNMSPQEVVIENDLSVTVADHSSYGWTISLLKDIVSANDPIEINLYSETSDDILWMIPKDYMVVGTSTSEFIVSEISQSQVLGPENIKMTATTSYGSSNIKPLTVSNEIFFIQFSGTKFRSFIFNGNQYESLDLSVISEHLISNGIQSFDWQFNKQECFWIITNDKKLVTLNYKVSEDLICWSRHTSENNFEQVLIYQGNEGENDFIYFLIERDGSYYLEKLIFNDIFSDLSNQIYLDSHVIINSANPINTVNDLTHLNNKYVSILVDNILEENKLVVNNTILLDTPGKNIKIGLPYISEFKSLPFETITNRMDTFGSNKKIIDCKLNLLNSFGGEINKEELIFRKPEDQMNLQSPLFTGPYKVFINNYYSSESSIDLIIKQPFPFNIRSILFDIEVSGRN